MPSELAAAQPADSLGIRMTPQAAFGTLMAAVMALTLTTAVWPGWTELLELFGSYTMTVIVAMLIAMMMTAVPVCLCLMWTVLGRSMAPCRERAAGRTRTAFSLAHQNAAPCS